MSLLFGIILLLLFYHNVEVLSKGGCERMILTVREFQDNHGYKWTFDALNDISLAKAVVECKNKGIYGKILYDNGIEQELFYNSLDSSNKSHSIQVFEGYQYAKQLYTGLTSCAKNTYIGEVVQKLTFNNGLYPSGCCQFKRDYTNCTLKRTMSENKEIFIHIYKDNLLVAIITQTKTESGKQYIIYAENSLDMVNIVPLFICYRIYKRKKRFFSTLPPTKTLHKFNKDFIYKIKEIEVAEMEIFYEID